MMASAVAPRSQPTGRAPPVRRATRQRLAQPQPQRADHRQEQAKPRKSRQDQDQPEQPGAATDPARDGRATERSTSRGSASRAIGARI
jgi:hypothetical protein